MRQLELMRLLPDRSHEEATLPLLGVHFLAAFPSHFVSVFDHNGSSQGAGDRCLR